MRQWPIIIWDDDLLVRCQAIALDNSALLCQECCIEYKLRCDCKQNTSDKWPINNIDDLAQECSNSIVNATVLR